MRIVLVERWAGRGGAQDVGLDLLAEFQRPGHDAQLWLLNSGPLVDDAKARGVPVQVVALRRNQLMGLAPLTVRLARRLRREQVDVVLGNGTTTRLFVGPAAVLSRAAFGWLVFDAVRVNGRRRRHLARASGVVPVDLAVLYGTPAQRTAPALPGRLRRVRAADPPVDLTRLRDVRTESRHPRLGLPESARVVVMLARMVRPKRHLDLVEAFGRVAGEVDDAWLVMLGGADESDPFVSEVRAAVAASPCAERILLAGYVDEGVRNAIVASGRVLVHPAGVEPFGLPVVQARALGVPVIAAAAEGPSRTLAGSRAGILYPPGDVDALAAALRDVLSDDARWARMAAAGPGEVEQFGLEAHVDELEGQLAKLVESRRR
jgi:glycosyltransferase involved in cell wall biosynthesis